MNGRSPAKKSQLTVWWRSYWVAGFIGLTLLIGIAGQYNLLRQIGRPFPGFLSYSNLHGGYWTVAENTPPWWPGISQTGLQYSDRIMKLDGQPFGVDQAAVFNQAYQANRPAAITISRQGVEMELETAVIPFSLTHFLEIKTPHIIIGFGFWLLALTIYATRPAEPLNRMFALVACLTAINQWLWIRFLFHLELHPLSNTLDFIVLLYYTFSPPILAHAALLFPPPSRWARPRFLLLLYSLTPFFVTLFAARRILLWQGETAPFWLSQLEQAAFHATQILALTAVILFMLRLLILAYRQRQARLPMSQYYILLTGFIPPVLYAARIIWTSVGGTNFSSWRYLIDWRYVFLATPLAVAFVIIRYQTFRGSNKTILAVFALTISALSASVGSSVLRQGNPQLTSSANAIPPFVTLFAIMFLFSVGWLYLSAPGGIVGWLLHREARQYGDVKLFGQGMIGQTNLPDLPQAIIRSLRQLHIDQAAIWLLEEETAVYHLTAQSGQWTRPLPANLFIPSTIPERPGQIIRINTPGYPLPSWLCHLQPQPSIKLAGLLGQNTLIGVLVLGTQWDEEIYTERDLEIMELVVQQASLSLLTAVQINELRQIPRHIMNAQEQERLRIARELHDTTQQFLGRLPFRLAVSRKNIPTDPEKSDLILQECLDDISEAAMTLRHIRSNLAPTLTETNLTYSLQVLTDRFKHRTGIHITLEMPAQLDELLEANSRHVLYRVIQQALDNVETHANATTVKITLQHRSNKLAFVIADNGIGFSADDRKRAEASGSFGFQSMETRIKSQSGDLAIYSIPEQGAVVSGWIHIYPQSNSA